MKYQPVIFGVLGLMVREPNQISLIRLNHWTLSIPDVRKRQSIERGDSPLDGSKRNYLLISFRLMIWSIKPYSLAR
jgi:hypothetical protein